MAMKPKSKKTKTTVPQAILPPPTPREVKERATRRIATEKQRKKTGRRFENSGSESEGSDDLPIISVEKTVQSSAEAQTAIAQSGQTAIAQSGADIGIDQDAIPALGGELDTNPRDPSASNPGDQAKKRTTRNARLVSYSSQESS